MTNMWKRIAIGSAIVAGAAVFTYLVWPARIQAAGLMGGRMAAMMNGGSMKAMMNGSSSGMMSGDMGQMHEQMAGLHTKEQAAAAQALGMSAEELATALKEGRGVADLAKEKGMSVDKLTEAVNSARKAAFDELVAAGTLTQEQADQMIEHMGQVGLMTLNMGTMMQNGGSCHGAKAPTI